MGKMNHLNTTASINDEKPSAVIDNSLLQAICKLSAETSDALIHILQRKCHLVATPILIEEIVVSYFRLNNPNKPLFLKMLKMIQEAQPFLMEEPLELIFREFILGEDIRASLQLNNHMARMYWEVIGDPDSLSAEATQWIEGRTLEKLERRGARMERQAKVGEKIEDQSWNFSNSADFMERTICRLSHEMDYSSDLRIARLDYYLGRNLTLRHPNSWAAIQKAFAEARFDSLDKTRFTRNYLLNELLYDWAPISKTRNASGDYFTILNAEKNKQSNDEEDQQYVASALAWGRGWLLTCDKSMSLIAGFFSERKLWTGKSVYISPYEIEKLESYLV